VTPVNIQQPQALSLMAFQEMLPDMFPGVKSTCGLSNISNGPPGQFAADPESDLYGYVREKDHVLMYSRCL